MMLKFYITKSIKSVRHLGFLGVIVSLSVFFSGFSAFSIISLSNEFAAMVTANARERIGGDVTLYAFPEELEQKEAFIKDLQSKGIIKNYTKIALGREAQSQSKDGQIIYAQFSAVEKDNYPIVDSYKLKSGKSFGESLSEKDSVIVSQDMLERLDKKVGDDIFVFDWDPLYNHSFKITDVIGENNTREGNLVFTSYDSFQNYSDITGYRFLTVGDTDKIVAAVSKEYKKDDYQTVAKYNEENKSIVKTFKMFFRGMSILGIFIGSLGIVSSMDVLISKRRSEIAVLKTVGYKKGNIVKMFLFELLGISILGGLAGMFAGYAFFYYLVVVLNSIFNGVVLQRGFDLDAFAVAFMASIISTVIFTSYTIISNLELKPADLLRDNITDFKTRRFSLQKILLVILIALSFAGLSGLIVGDLLVGAAVAGGAIGGMFVASLLFRVLVWLILRLPLKTKSILGLVWINLRGNYKKSIFGIIAIFVGITCIGLIFAMMKTSNEELDSNLGNMEADYNVVAFVDGTRGDKVTEIENKLNNEKQSGKINNYFVASRIDTTKYMNTDIQPYVSVLEGRDPNNIGDDILISEGNFANSTGIFLEDYNKEYFKKGDTLKINGTDVKIDGFYKMNSLTSRMITNNSIILTTEDTFMKMFADKKYQRAYVISARAQDVTSIANSLKDVKSTLVFDIASLEKQIQNTIVTLVWVVVSIASLALVAGTILIINTANLEVVNRKKQFGILKAIGFKNSQVRSLFLMEFGILILIAAIISFMLDYVVIRVVNKIEPWGKEEDFAIIFDTFGTLGVIAVTTILILVLIYFSSRKYLNVKPVELLRYEG